MWKPVSLFVIAMSIIAFVPCESQAFWRRKCVPVPTCCVPQGQPAIQSELTTPHQSHLTPHAGAAMAARGMSTRKVVIEGKTYTIVTTSDSIESNEMSSAAGAAMRSRPTRPTNSQEAFDGTSRRKSKITIATNVPVKTFDSVNQMVAGLPSSAVMKPKNISRDSDSDRVDEEKFTLVVNAFIYGFKKEGDNDYHVIIGDAPGTPNIQFVNVEISGLPDPGEGTRANRNQLMAVRAKFRDAFDLGLGWNGGYERLTSNPVPVRLTGSAFWDIEHEPPATVGPNWAKAKTAWEIHPISDIEFLTN